MYTASRTNAILRQAVPTLAQGNPANDTQMAVPTIMLGLKAAIVLSFFFLFTLYTCGFHETVASRADETVAFRQSELSVHKFVS